MDPELKRELDDIHALVKDNHRMLRAVRRHQLFETFGRYALWIIVAVLSYYSYAIYLQPFVQRFVVDPSGTTSSLFGLPTSVDLQKLVNSYKSGNKVK